MADDTTTDSGTGTPILDAEVANRQLDPFEVNYLGVLRTNDPLLLERGGGGSTAYDIYRDLLRDGKVFASMQKRKLAVIGRPWQVEPVEDGGAADAEIVTDMLKRMNFDAACGSLMDALLYGFVPAEVIWTVRDGLIVPQRLVAHRQRRFVYVQDDAAQPPQLRMLTRESMIRGVELPQRKFIVHRLNPDDDNPYGTGMGLQLYWPVYFKRKGIVSWNKLNDRFGSPTPWGKYPRNSDPKVRETLFDALRAMSNDGVVITPEGMEVQLLESKLTGSVTTQQALVEYMDDWVAEVVLGQSPRGAGGGALAAASNEREQVRVELSQADSDLLSETLNNTLLKWICEINGLAPCVVYRVVKREEDLKAASEIAINVQSLGYRMTLDGVRAKFGEYWEAAPENVRIRGLNGSVSVPDGAPGGVSGSAPDGREANFAEGAVGAGFKPALTAADILAGKLGDAGDVVLADWMDRIKAMVEAANSPDELRANIEAAWDKLPTDELARVIELALLAAELAGMYDAGNEAGHGR
jgi:phage gp29-like protein